MNAKQRRTEKRALIRELKERGVRYTPWSSLNALRRVHKQAKR